MRHGLCLSDPVSRRVLRLLQGQTCYAIQAESACYQVFHGAAPAGNLLTAVVPVGWQIIQTLCRNCGTYNISDRIPARVPHPGGCRVLELTAGLVVISIAFTPDLRD
jgi:hypothetical protein